jgi:hypothetical protein
MNMQELIDFLNYVDSGLWEIHEETTHNIKENPCGLWGFYDGIQ